MPGLPLVESPLFPALMPTLGLNAEEERISNDLYRQGFAVFDFPDPELSERIERIKNGLGPLYQIDLADPGADKTTSLRRIQDAWKENDDVRAIAENIHVTELLSKIYGRAAFPFQTLNFPVGTQQDAHSDAVHFSSLPERFMCGVWLAMEDISADAGPLFYYPGSHRWPIMSNAIVERRGFGSDLQSAQDPYAPAWQALCEAQGAEQQIFLARKGQALIWCANLLHGGSVQNDPRLTRWSQVTHYYFENCIYYTPAFSDETTGHLQLRNIYAISDGIKRPNVYLGEEVKFSTPEKPPAATKPSIISRILRRALPKES